MVHLEKLVEYAREFDSRIDEKRKVKEAWKHYKEFIRRFPFREKPEKIDELTPEELYNPGSRNYFFYYVEHKLKELGHLRIGSAVTWIKAVENIEIFKRLLKIAVSNEPLNRRVDAEWQSIPFWGGDKTVAKKIIFLYDPENIVPIFKTKDLEHFVEQIGISREEIDSKANSKFGIAYDELSLGQKYEGLNEVLLEVKSRVELLMSWDNTYYVRFLYSYFSPPKPRYVVEEKKPEPLAKVPLLMSPIDELGVVLLFGIYHRKLGFPYILKASEKFPDAEVVDSLGNVRKVEFEYKASNFREHRHDPEKCDFIVCWIDDLPEDDELKDKIISLREFIFQES